MNDDQQRQAIGDLLEHCRVGRDLTIGRELAPMLLQRECRTTEDEWDLEEAMRNLLRSELAHARTLVGLDIPVGSSSATHKEALPQDIKTRKKNLKVWSVLWAHYICDMPHEEIAAVCGWTKRNSELAAQAGREKYVTRKIAALGQVPISSSHALQDPIPGSVKAASPDITNLLFAIAMLLIVLMTWLLATWSWPSIGVLLVAALWRTASHGRTLMQRWSLEDDQRREDTWWHVGYMLSWFGLVAWTTVVAVQNQAAATTVTLLTDRIALLLAFFCVSATICMLSVFDVLLWVNRADRLQWPWKLLEPYARGCWQTRWYFVAIGWALLFASVMPQLLPAL